MSLRQTTNPKNIKENKPTEKEKSHAKDILVEKLRERVKKLEQDKHLLIEQLVDYTEIKDENERLKQKVVGLHEKP